MTVLTSMDDADLTAAGYASGTAALVGRAPPMRKAAGMDGIVCSPNEIASAREIVGRDMLIVTPGVRPAGAAPATRSG